MTQQCSWCNNNARRYLAVIALLTGLNSLSKAYAHEYWLDPVDSQWQVGQVFTADIRNGENFIGTAYPFDADSLRVGGLISDTGRRPLRGRLGDYPAIKFKLNEPGLHLSLLETTARELRYDNAQAFNNFLDYHALRDAFSALSEQVLEKGSIRERYYRFAKTLFNVAPAGSTQTGLSILTAMTKNRKANALQPQGQRYELVANTSSAAELEVAVLLNGTPLAGRQIEIFHLNGNGTVATRRVKTSDPQGKIRFSIDAAGNYLVNSVWISKPETNDVDWETYWASLTFSR